jgi:hypothetical protein
MTVEEDLLLQRALRVDSVMKVEALVGTAILPDASQ